MAAAPPATGTTGDAATSNAIIPDAGVYGAETAAAVNAYNNAVAQASAQRNSLYNQYGLNNSGSVDPNNPYGEYEQMLNAQASQFQGDQEDSAARNLGSGGLANQQLSQDKRAANAQDFGFQQSVNNVSSQYNQELQDALNTKQGSISQAYNDALNAALANLQNQLASGNYTAPGSGKPAPDTTTPAPKPKGGHGGHGGHGHGHNRGRRSGGGGPNRAN